jgi:nitrite reductase/ring-hydroxylating ferredoxin subunit
VYNAAVALPLIEPGEVICPADALADGSSMKFLLRAGDRPVEAFLIRFEGRHYAYRNRCAHMALGLDFDDNDFFTVDQRALICKTHGAVYHPDSGVCFSGPCYGEALDPVAIEVRDGRVVLAA